MLDLSKGKSFPIKRFITTLTPRGGTKLSTLKIINVPSYKSDTYHVFVVSINVFYTSQHSYNIPLTLWTLIEDLDITILIP